MVALLSLLFLFESLISAASGTGNVLIGELSSKIDRIEKQCAAHSLELQHENQMLNEHIEKLTSSLKNQEYQISLLQEDVKELQQNRDEKVKDVDAGLKRHSRFVADQESTVAFHATLAGGRAIQHLHINQTVIFDNVMLNMGGAYHSQQGLFVTNVQGIYIFSVSIMALSGGSDSTMVFIMKNGKEVAAAIADGRGAPHDQGSTTVVLKLAVGDEVWVSVQRHDDTAIWTDSLDSFMGCLVAYT